MELRFARAARTTKDFDLGLVGNRAELMRKLEEVLKLGFDAFTFRLKPESVVFAKFAKPAFLSKAASEAAFIEVVSFERGDVVQLVRTLP